MSAFPLQPFVSSGTGDDPSSVLQHDLLMPTEPSSIADTGLNMGFLSDLVLKHVYFAGTLAGQQLADNLKLPFLNVVDYVLHS